ncbi:uncharacterized protein LOC110693755 [Chenopodium quinoa]|uniref:uncharacterized protein LOC110693755 n=1 Tax=Chenopodium quinoa TaxID=63459 RepID=UPI000B783BCA|nr:uncharacterized protein LOC110693755 [Chenopodium quinoa]
MAKQSTSSTSKFKLTLLAFLMLTIVAPTIGRMQPTTETIPKVMKTLIQELGKEQLGAYYMQETIMAANQQLDLEEPKLAMFIEQNQLKCTGRRGYCDINNPNCCEGLTCQRIKYPDTACL